MSAWPVWVLIIILSIAAFILVGAGRITTGPRMHNRSDRYDPVHFHQQEAMEAEATFRRKQ